MIDGKLTCPYCDEQFTKSEAAWSVCLTCGRIAPPGESQAGHGPGPAAPGPVPAQEHRRADGRERAVVSAECCSSLRVYSPEAAVEKREEVREKYRPRYEDAGAVPRWERPGYDGGWQPDGGAEA